MLVHRARTKRGHDECFDRKAAGTFSQLKISGAASLGGTLTAAEVNDFTPTIGQKFTILTAASVTGTFANSTVAINGSEHLVVPYTPTGVVLRRHLVEVVGQ